MKKKNTERLRITTFAIAALALSAVSSIAAMTVREERVPTYPAGYGVRADDVAQKISSGQYKTVPFSTNGGFPPVTVQMGEKQANIQVSKDFSLTIDDVDYAGVSWDVPVIITSTDGSYPLDVVVKRGDVRMVSRDLFDMNIYYELPMVRILQPDTAGTGRSLVVTDPVHLNTTSWSISGPTPGPNVLWLDFDATYQAKQSMDISLPQMPPTYIIIGGQYLLPVPTVGLPTIGDPLYDALARIVRNVKVPAGTGSQQPQGKPGQWLTR